MDRQKVTVRLTRGTSKVWETLNRSTSPRSVFQVEDLHLTSWVPVRGEQGSALALSTMEDVAQAL